jgi:hypothetical protein
MKNLIKENVDYPAKLESLYRGDKKAFENAFFEVFPEISENKIAAAWKARLEPENTDIKPVDSVKNDFLLLIIACAVTGFLIQLPHIFNTGLTDDLYYKRNAALTVMLGMSLYAFLIKGRLKSVHSLITMSVILAASIYVNLLPSDKGSQSQILVFLHLPLLLWCLYGLVYIDFDFKDRKKRISYIKFNGDLAILGALLAIAGGILTGVTVGLFSAIELNIGKFYSQYIIITGIVVAPLVATFILRKFPTVTSKIAPIIASLFSPLVLITLVVYLVSIIISGKDPYNDRDFLIIFNMMLLGVMALVVFSVSETSSGRKQKINEILLFILTAVTLIIDLVALSAILYRLKEFGLSPNRVAVLGSNLLVFGNLVLIMLDLFHVSFRKKDIERVELTISGYLPVYALWSVIVVFILPLVFSYK